MNKFIYQITDDHIESKYQHVHHATALHFLEQGRVDYLLSHGIEYHQNVENGLLMVIAKIEVTYRKELTKGEITVVCKNPTIRKQFVGLTQEILLPDNTVAVSAEVLSVFMDAKNRRSMPPSKEFVEKFLDELKEI